MAINPAIQKYFDDIVKKVDITLFPEKSSRTFKSLDSFLAFIEKEVEFWRPCENGKASEIRVHFQNALTSLTSTVTQNDPSAAQRLVDNAVSQVRRNAFPCVFSSTSAGQFIRTMYETSPAGANAACQFLFLNQLVLDMPSRQTMIFDARNFKGVLQAFMQTEYRDIGLDAERKALSALRKEYADNLSNLQTDYLAKTQTNDNSYNAFKNGITEWKETTEKELADFVDDGKKRQSELEDLYEEKLRLAKPASYWDTMSKEYMDKGKSWRTWAVVTGIVTVVYLTILLFNIPDKFLPEKSTFTFNGMKATIVFALIASILVYFIRLFVKLATSAYHLSRDAYERYQLTYVYLSLLNEKAVKEEERNIVLQSIFSRADTGLLKGDSTPAFPEGVISQLLKK